MRQHFEITAYSLHHQLNTATALLVPQQARRNHPGVVKHHEITRLNQMQNLGKLAMANLSRFAIEGQQPATPAFSSGVVGNQGFRQVVVKKFPAHSNSLSKAARLTDFAAIAKDIQP